MKVVRFLSLTAVAAAALSAGAIDVVNDPREPITAIWTGGGSNFYWTNDLNWAGGVAPGSSIKKDADGNEYINYWPGCTAIFTNSVFNYEGRDRTVSYYGQIRIRGLRSIGNVILAGETCPEYRFRTDGNAAYSFENPFPLEQGGEFYIAENYPHDLYSDTPIVPGGVSSTAGGIAVLKNDSEHVLDIYCEGQYVGEDFPVSSLSFFELQGKGDIRWRGWRSLSYWPGYRFAFNGGKLIWENGNTDLQMAQIVVPPNVGRQTLQIAEGSRLGQWGWMSSEYLLADDDFDILGPGGWTFSESNTLGMRVAPGKTVTVTAVLRNTNGIWVWNGGTVVLDQTNLNWKANALIGTASTLRIPRKIGNVGEDGPLTPDNIGLTFYGKGSVFEYAGPGEQTDRPIAFDYDGYFSNRGEGPLRLDGVFTGSSQIGVRDCLNEVAFVGDSFANKLVLASGAKVAFRLQNSDRSQQLFELSELKVDGDATLEIESFVELDVAAVTHTAGTLTVNVQPGAKLVLPDDFIPGDWFRLTPGSTMLIKDAEGVRAESLDAETLVEMAQTDDTPFYETMFVAPSLALVMTIDPSYLYSSAFAFGAFGGEAVTMEFSGDYSADFTLQAMGGKLRLTSDDDAVVTTEGILVGAGGELVLDGVHLRQKGFDLATYTGSDMDPLAKPMMVVGTNGTGKLTIESGSYTGLVRYARGGAKSPAACYVKGGTLHHLGSPSGAETDVTGGYLYQKVSGSGKIVAAGDIYMAYPTSEAVTEVDGGSFIWGEGVTGARRGRLRFGGRWDTSESLILVKSGCLEMNGMWEYMLMPGYGRVNTSSTLTIEGGTNRLPNIEMGKASCSDYYPECYSVLNLNGGVTYAPYAIERQKNETHVSEGGSQTGDDYLKRKSYVNFNGGVLRMRENADIFGSEISGTAIPPRLVVYEKGLTLDMNGYYFQQRCTFTTPTGKGVVSVPLPDALVGMKLMGPPVVQIRGGDGQGATAYCEFDEASGTVTGVVVSSSGWGFADEAPTARFYYNNHQLLGSSTCVLGENVGGSVACTNGYVNAERQMDDRFTGELFVQAGAAVTYLSDGGMTHATLVLDGGSVAFRTNCTFKSVRATSAANGAKTSRFEGASLIFNGFTCDLADARAGSVVNVGATPVTFAAPIAVTGLTAEAMERSVAVFPLLKFTGEILGDLPELAAETEAALGPMWRLETTAAGLQLRHRLPTAILLR